MAERADAIKGEMHRRHLGRYDLRWMATSEKN
jgi:hypothetical protein